MNGKVVVILGAGATKACGGPFASEILTRGSDNAYQIDREDFLATLGEFLAVAEQGRMIEYQKRAVLDREKPAHFTEIL